MSTPPPVGDAPNSPHAILLQSGCISANLSRAFQEWRDPYYASSASFAPPPATYVRKVSRLVVPAAPKPAAKPVDKVLGAYSLSSSDDEEELHPVPVKQPAPLAPSVVAQPGFDALISNGGDEPRSRKRNRWDNELSSQEEAWSAGLGVWGCDRDLEEGEITP